MNADFLRVKEIFLAAVEQPDAAARDAYVCEACGHDEDLRRQVNALLARHEQAGSFLEPPAPGPAATVDERPISEGPGAVIGPYKLLEQIGEGGFGVVYMAEQTQPVRRKVALKVLKPGMDTRQVVARFEAERQALAIMDHPNIAKVFDGGATPSGRPYFVMELVKGLPVTDYCDQNHLTPRQRLELFLSVCQAVQHAHQKGIIHRDLKPSNVLVTVHDTTPVVKVIDFGVAKALGQELTDKTLFTGFAQMIGTPLYMSPEQAGQSGLDVDTRSDVYSLGVLLYELLTGTTPFSRERFKRAAYDEIRRIIRDEEPPKPSTRLSDSKDSLPSISAQRHTEPAKLTKLVRGELDWIVMKSLEKDRDRRYETANGFAQDVQRYLADEPVHAGAPSGWYRFRKFARRNRSVLAVAGTVLLLLLLLGGGSGWVVRDRATRAAALGEEVARALAEADDFYRRGQWPEALAAAKRADGLLAGGAGSEDLRQRVRDQLRDLEMVIRLETIRSGRRVTRDDLAPAEAEADKGAGGRPATAERADDEAADRAYAAAFRGYGIDADALDPGEAAERLRGRAVHTELAASLDDWAMVRRAIGTHEGRSWKELLALARAADPDEVRDRVRDAWERRDVKALVALARSDSAGILEMPTLALLTQAVDRRNSWIETPHAVNLLRRAIERRPDDFWVNYRYSIYLGAQYFPRWDDALRFATAAAALRPGSARAHANLGSVLQSKRGSPDDAVAAFRKAIALQPDDWWPHGLLGRALAALAKPGEAEAEFREAIRLNPVGVWPRKSLASLLADQGKAAAAEAEFREAFLLAPGEPEVNGRLADLLAKAGRPARKEMEALHREAVRRRPGDAPARRAFGDFLMQQGKAAEAETEVREALRLDPEDGHAFALLIRLYVKQGKVAELEGEFRQATGIHPGDARTHSRLGDVLFQQQKYAEAEAEFRQALRLDPSDEGFHNQLFNALSIQKDDAALETAYREWLRIRPEDGNTHNSLGVLLSKQEGKVREAEAEYREAIRLGQLHLNNLNALLSRQGREAEVEAVLQEAVRLRPNDPLVHAEVASRLSRRGKYTEAEAEYRQAVRLLPGKAYYHLELGQFLSSFGRHAEAEAEHREALRLERSDHSTHSSLGSDLNSQGKYAEAESEYREALRLWHAVSGSDREDYRYSLGLVLLEQEKFAEAEAEFRELVRLPDHFNMSGAGVQLGRLLERREKWAEAEAQYREAIRRNPDHASGYGELAQLLQRQGRVSELAELQAKKPKAAAIGHFMLASELAGQGKLEEVEAEYRAAVRLDPGNQDYRKALINHLFREGKYTEVDELDPTPGVRRFVGHEGRICFVAFCPDGRRAVSASGGPFASFQDRTLRLWDVPTGKELRRFEGHAAKILAAALSQDGHRLLSAGDDGTVRLWDVDGGKELRRLDRAGLGTALAFSPNGKRALLGRSDGLVRLWDVDGWRELRRFDHPSVIRSVAFSPDGRHALVAGGMAAFRPKGHAILRLWDLESGRDLRRFPEARIKGLWQAVFSPDGQQVLIVGLDMTVQLWDVGAGKELRSFQVRRNTPAPNVVHWPPETERQMNEVTAVAFSPDGRRALTGGWSKVVLWDVASGKRLGSPDLASDSGFVRSVAFSPDGRHALFGQEDYGGVRLWPLPAAGAEPLPKKEESKP